MVRPISLVILAVSLTACGDDPAPTEPPADAPPGSTFPAAHPVDHGSPAAEGAFHAAPAGATVAFGAPADGATVPTPVALTFRLDGMQVAPAGTLTIGTGHHHVIVDGAPVPEGETVPADETHIHFGKGQTETTLELPPGEHTLTLQLADGLHRSYGSRLSQTITVTVSGG